jgi:hypothetical protein
MSQVAAVKGCLKTQVSDFFCASTTKNFFEAIGVDELSF